MTQGNYNINQTHRNLCVTKETFGTSIVIDDHIVVTTLDVPLDVDREVEKEAKPVQHIEGTSGAIGPVLTLQHVLKQLVCLILALCSLECNM